MKWKSCAYEAGMSFREWVVETLNAKAGASQHIPASSQHSPRIEAPLKVEYERKPENRKPTPEEEMAIIMEAQRKLEERKKEVVPIAPLMGRAGHSPKTCRLYGCLQCKEAGHKDPIRGV